MQVILLPHVVCPQVQRLHFWHQCWLLEDYIHRELPADPAGQVVIMRHIQGMPQGFPVKVLWVSQDALPGRRCKTRPR